ncbi:hypothetical protein FRC01_014470, partial [Tulasnella sp. 417]
MVTDAVIKRSGSTSLCLYCIKALPPALTRDQVASEELQTCIPRIQTLRSDDPDAYLLCRYLLRTRTPALQTLKLLGETGPVERVVEPLGDLSPIRHLTAFSWQPSPGLIWLNGLRELNLAHLSRLNTEIILVLSACTSLESLYVQCGGLRAVGDLQDAPSQVTLPCLQTMDLAFESDDSAVNLIQRLAVPQILRTSLYITRATLNLDLYVADYCAFMSLPGERCIQPPNVA